MAHEHIRLWICGRHQHSLSSPVEVADSASGGTGRGHHYFPNQVSSWSRRPRHEYGFRATLLGWSELWEPASSPQTEYGRSSGMEERSNNGKRD